MRHFVLVVITIVAAGCGPTTSDDESLGVTSQALREGPDFQARLQSEVVPYCEANLHVFSPDAAEVQLPYAKFEVPEGETEKAALVIIPGRTETFLKNCELAHQLRGLGYSIYMPELRGQGSASRTLIDRMRGHVDSFEHYVADTQSFIDKVVNARPHTKRYVIAHSLGAAILTRILQRAPGTFDAAVLSSPMYQVNAGALPESVAWFISSVGTRLGFGRSYVIGTGPYTDEGDAFATNRVTGSLARWRINHELWATRRDLPIGGPTFQWLNEATWATYLLRRDAHLLVTPTLIFQAGDEHFVVNAAQNYVCQRAANCRIVLFPEAKHEIFSEVDSIRDSAIEQTLAFFGE